MRFLRIRPSAATLAALAYGLAHGAASGAEAGAQAFDLKAGQELTFAVKVEGGKVALSAPRASKLGVAQPKDGEMTVGLTPRDKTLYEQVVVSEKTPVPIDFLATGLVGGTKIDEAVLCGRLDAPVSAHIGAMSRRVSLHDFEVGKGGPTCP